VYVKGEGNRRERGPNAKEKKHWERVKKVGCITHNLECEGILTKHHTGTGAGGRKNHMKVLPLCWEHHLGDHGINSLTGAMSRREWERAYATEAELHKKLDILLKGIL
jgi:hypothetical protein